MLKLRDKYLKKFTILFLLFFVIVGAIVYSWLKDLYLKQAILSLENDIELIYLHVKDRPNLDKLVKDIKDRLSIRVTIIAEDGEVVAESDFDKNKMGNLKYAQEIMGAKQDGVFQAIRHSETLDKDLLYIAKKVTVSNKILYIRVATEVKKIYGKLSALMLESGIVLILFFTLLFWIVYKINKELQDEIRKIMKFLFDLTKKNKNAHIVSHFSKEFYDITRQLTKISKILAKQDKQKAKYTAKLKKSNEQKDDIISAISHEFKNPIAVINGYSQTLLSDNELNPQIRKKFLSKIEANGKKLSLLIDKLRLSIKLDEKKLKPNFVKVDVVELSRHIIEDIKQNYKKRDIVLHSEVENLYIEADATLLEVALSNLIENALKYSEGKVEVFISKDRVSIKDKGVGIPQKEIDKITKKFYRVNSNGWNNSLGLGLSIVTNILKLHGFELIIETQEEEGSNFSIIFKS